MGDPLCDAALAEVLSYPVEGKDLLGCLRTCVEDHPDAADAQRFLAEISQPPPSDIAVTAEDVKIAQEFFFDYFPQINIGLLFFAIAGGFARYVDDTLTRSGIHSHVSSKAHEFFEHLKRYLISALAPTATTQSSPQETKQNRHLPMASGFSPVY